MAATSLHPTCRPPGARHAPLRTPGRQNVWKILSWVASPCSGRLKVQVLLDAIDYEEPDEQASFENPGGDGDLLAYDSRDVI